jgi:hypothetical protein
MSKRVVRLPPDLVPALRVTASYLNEVDLDTLIAAAVWSFAQQDPGIKAAIVREFWYSGINRAPVKRKKSLLGRFYALGKHLYAQVCSCTAR